MGGSTLVALESDVMTDKKDLKAHIRARMEKTGESYTAARRHVVGSGTPWGPLVTTKPEPIHDQHDAYRFVAGAIDELDLRIFDETGRGVQDEHVVAMIDEMVAAGALTVAAGANVKPKVAIMIADYEWFATTGGIDDMEAILDSYG
jgi:hypothetical protein